MAVNKVIFGGETVVDLTQDTVTPETLLKGATAHDKTGEQIVGTYEVGGNTETEYETVDSVDEMTDTSKQYILSSTNTLWAYGETEPRPAYTNRADLNDTSDNNWISGYRISSSGTSSSSTATPAPMITNYIACATGDVVRIKGLTLGGYNVATYKTDKTIISASKPTFPSTISETLAEMDGTDTYKFIITGSKVGFIRFCGVPVGTASSIVITKNEEIKTVSGHAWYDTGLSPESASTGSNYVGLLEKINENKTDIAEVSNRVTALETGSDTLTIPTFWQSAVDTCIAKIKVLQNGRNCITFPFFSDNHQRNGYAGLLIAYIMKECHIPYAFFGGDSISSGYIADENEMIAQDKAFDSTMSYIPNGRLCRAVGNHDGYWAVSADEKHYYTDAQNYELFLREESTAQNKHFGGDGTYYYVDDIASKVRFVVLDTNDGTVEAEQIEWLQNTALSFTELGWAVVFISHQPISNHYHALISNAADVISVVNSSGVDIIGWYSGHIHRDRMYTGIAANTSDDTTGDPLGFTQITITSDNTAIAYDDATKHTVGNDDQSHAIDFVTVNRDTRTVNITRLGIGNDRSYTYSAAENPYEPVGDYVLTEEDKTEIAQVAAGLVDTELLAIIGTGEVTA